MFELGQLIKIEHFAKDNKTPTPEVAILSVNGDLIATTNGEIVIFLGYEFLGAAIVVLTSHGIGVVFKKHVKLL